MSGASALDDEPIAKRARFQPTIAGPRATPDTEVEEKVRRATGLFLQKSTPEALKVLAALEIGNRTTGSTSQHGIVAHEDVITLALRGFAHRQLRDYDQASKLLRLGYDKLLEALGNADDCSEEIFAARAQRFPPALLAAFAATACLDEVKPWELYTCALEQIFIVLDDTDRKDRAMESDTKTAAASTAGAESYGPRVGGSNESKSGGKADSAGPWVMQTAEEGDDITVCVHTRIGTTLLFSETGYSGMFRFSVSEGAVMQLCNADGEVLPDTGSVSPNEDVVRTLKASIKSGGGTVMSSAWSWGCDK